MLSAVIARQMSLTDMKEAAKRHRSMSTIKKAFCRLTNTTWEEAQERFGQYATEEKLVQFSSLDFKKSIPEAFQSYCHTALQSETASTSLPDCFQFEDAMAYIVDQNCLTVSQSDIRASGIPFDGSQLFIATITEVHMF